MNIFQLTAVLMISLISISVQAQGDAEAESEKAKQACAACHGADGNSPNPAWPKLAGQHEKYIILQINNFQKGIRVDDNNLMTPAVENLTEQDKADLAAYFSAQKPMPAKAKPELIRLGAKVYRAGNPDTGVPACLACHGPRGAGNPAAQYPSLSGQHAQYVEAQLNAFRTGDRENAVMHTIAGKMSDEEIKAVSDFVQGLH